MSLLTYVLRRLVILVATLIFLMFLLFAITQMFTPAERAMLYVTSPKQMSQLPGIIKEYGLDAPIYDQFFTWIRQVLRGNLGYSTTAGMPVLQALLTKLPATFELVVWSIPITILVGIYLGVQSAVHRDKSVDHITRVASIIGYSLPAFWLAIMLIAIFYNGLGIFPPERYGIATFNYIYLSGKWHTYTGLLVIDGLLNGQPWISLDALRHLVLPTVTLIVSNIAIVVAVVRSSVLEMIREKSANGQCKRTYAILHSATILSTLLFASMLASIMLVETVFNIDGVGRWVAMAASGSGGIPDIAPLFGFALFAGIVYVAANFIMDILYACIARAHAYF
jgi:peptide/nickel transport system permease protein